MTSILENKESENTNNIKYLLDKLYQYSKGNKSKYADLIISFYEMPDSFKFCIYNYIFKDMNTELLDYIYKYTNSLDFVQKETTS